MWNCWKILFITDIAATRWDRYAQTKKANLRTEWTKSTPICTPQNLYYIILNYKIGVSGTITKQQNRRYNCKKYKCRGKNTAFKKVKIKGFCSKLLTQSLLW